MLDIGLNLIFQPYFSIFICVDCKTSLGSTAICHHVREWHSLSLTDSRISEWISTLEPSPLDTKELSQLAVTHSAWVPELPVCTSYQCDSCGKCLTSRNKISTHCNKHDPRASWAETIVQTLVEVGNRRTYYKVSPEISPLPEHHTPDIMNTFFAQQHLEVTKGVPVISGIGQDTTAADIRVEEVNKVNR